MSILRTFGPYVAGALLLIGAIWFIYDKGGDSRETEVRAEWAEANQKHEDAIDSLEKMIVDLEIKHRQQSREISDEIVRANEDYSRTVAELHGAYVGRLRNSEARAVEYERLSDAGAVERANLASHAAQLDRSLEQGRLLVGELRSGIVQRDNIIASLGNQILADRQLINSTPGLEISEETE